MEADPVKNKDAWPEPPMPRDFHLLPEVSQQLLRAARSGKIRKAPEPSLDDDKDPADEDEEAKGVPVGFVMKKWARVPRHLEEPEPEFLAKRRKGLQSAYSNSNWSGAYGPLAPAANLPMRKTKVKKTDIEGNVQIYEVMAPQGQSVPDEIVAEEVPAENAAATAAPGTVIEGVGVVNNEGVVVATEAIQPTPPRRRPPPPRRKAKKGPGRGRKKVVFAPDAEGANGVAVVDPNGLPQANGVGIPTVTAEGLPGADGDTSMLDAQEGEGEGDDDDEDGEEGDEGDEGDDDEDREDGELSPTPNETDNDKRTQAPVSEIPAATTVPGPPVLPTDSTTTETQPQIAIEETPAPDAVPHDEALGAESAVIDAPAPSTTLQPPERPAHERDPSSSPELPLATAVSHSRQNSMNQTPNLDTLPAEPKESKEEASMPAAQQDEPAPASAATEGELDLLGSLERHLDNEGKPDS